MTEERKDPHKGIDEKVLATVMKKFLSTKKSDPEHLKFYQVVDNVDYYATSMGSAAGIMFVNKYDYRDGTKHYVKPLPKDKKELADHVPNYPDVKNLFEEELDGYEEIVITDIDKWIAIHETMVKTKPLTGMYGTAKMTIRDGKIIINLHDNEAKLYWKYHIESDYMMQPYFYDFELMLGIWKSIKDLKLESIKLMVKNNQSPLHFVGSSVEYNFRFALNRKLVK
ncbi:hypothetical protein [Priestia megaterium]|uniref:hypothetical protein n=1 Tax=Priestia megaterium TaxID=1404 RepID=UPI00211C2E12|nr:hypothetical protein [Priestia megaterium]